jgi:hypothetical protein
MVKAGGITNFNECFYLLSGGLGCRFNAGGKKSVSISSGLTVIPLTTEKYDEDDAEPDFVLKIAPALSFRVCYQF